MWSRRLDALKPALEALDQWRAAWPDDAADPLMQVDEDRLGQVLAELARRLQGNYPFHSPLYAGQMLKPPHPVAWMAHVLASTINPNNHALDGGPPTSEMEKEVVADLARLFGFRTHLGHLTSGGTAANLEALWVARETHPGKAIAFSDQAHYTHARMCAVLGVESVVIPTTADGSWDMSVLKASAHRIGTVVVTLGTTGMGRVEALHELLPFCRQAGLRVHVDAAYGGFYKLLEASGALDAAPWALTGAVDSLVVDPHKHGLQPYGCGCVLFRDPAVGRHYKHDSPYTYFTSDELHLGEISLECSRAGASAAALWATWRLLGGGTDSGLARMLAACRRAALAFAAALEDSGTYAVVDAPDLDIVVYHPRPTGARRLSDLSAASKAVFRKGMQAGPDQLFLSLYQLPASRFAGYGLEADADTVTVLRSVLMKPGHEGYATELAARLVRLLSHVERDALGQG